MSTPIKFDVPAFLGSVTSHDPQTAIKVLAQVVARLAVLLEMFPDALESVEASHEEAADVRSRKDRAPNILAD